MGRDDERSGKMGGAEAVARFKQYDYKAVGRHIHVSAFLPLLSAPLTLFIIIID